MHYTAGAGAPRDLFPELTEVRKRSARRRKWTRAIMIGLSFLAGLLLAGLAYLAFWLISISTQFALNQVHGQAENPIAVIR